MPLPKPEKNEDKQKFVARCMSDKTMKTEYPDAKQRTAVCLSQSAKITSSLIENVQENLLSSNATWG